MSAKPAAALNPIIGHVSIRAPALTVSVASWLRERALPLREFQVTDAETPAATTLRKSATHSILLG